MNKQDNDFLNGIEGDITEKQKDIEYIEKCIADAMEYGLESQVLYSAMLHLKENPSEDIKTAMEVGMAEWDV